MKLPAAFRGDLRDALTRVGFPIFITDTAGRHVWMNEAAIDLVGNRIGQPFGGAILPEYRQRAQEMIRRRLRGDMEPAEFDAVVKARDGRLVRVEVSAVPLRVEGHVIGIFGIAHDEETVEPAKRPRVEPIPRQMEVLRGLARGLSTAQLVDELGISPETVRNHVRGIFRVLGVHSRLEAVLRAQQLDLV